MKKIIFFVILFFFIFLWKTNLTPKKSNLNIPASPVVSPSPFTKIYNSKEITFGTEKYDYALYEVGSKSKINLFPNFLTKDTSVSLAEKYKCSALFNGSFYTKDEKPLGMFETGGKVLKKYSVNRLINGIIYQDLENSLIISETIPEENIIFAIQSGPVLVKNNLIQNLSIKDDYNARRVVVAKDDSDKIYFIAVYKKEMKFDGPKLGDLPEVLNIIGDVSKIKISDAINLDGGSASVFLTQELKLEELKPVGSVFCIN